MRQGIFLPESTFSADSLTGSVQLPCAIACINVHAHVKIPNTYSHTTVQTHENIPTLTGMGSAALVMAVPDPGKVTQIFPKVTVKY